MVLRFQLAKQLAYMDLDRLQEIAAGIAANTRAGLRSDDLAQAMRQWARDNGAD